MKNVYNHEIKKSINFKPIDFDFFQIENYPRINFQSDSIDPLKQPSFIFRLSC